MRATIFHIEYCWRSKKCTSGTGSGCGWKGRVLLHNGTPWSRDHPFLISIAQKFEHETKSLSKNFSIAKVWNAYWTDKNFKQSDTEKLLNNTLILLLSELSLMLFNKGFVFIKDLSYLKSATIRYTNLFYTRYEAFFFKFIIYLFNHVQLSSQVNLKR